MTTTAQKPNKPNRVQQAVESFNSSFLSPMNLRLEETTSTGRIRKEVSLGSKDKIKLLEGPQGQALLEFQLGDLRGIYALYTIDKNGQKQAVKAEDVAKNWEQVGNMLKIFGPLIRVKNEQQQNQPTLYAQATYPQVTNGATSINRLDNEINRLNKEKEIDPQLIEDIKNAVKKLREALPVPDMPKNSGKGSEEIEI